MMTYKEAKEFVKKWNINEDWRISDIVQSVCADRNISRFYYDDKEVINDVSKIQRVLIKKWLDHEDRII